MCARGLGDRLPLDTAPVLRTMRKMAEGKNKRTKEAELTIGTKPDRKKKEQLGKKKCKGRETVLEFDLRWDKSKGTKQKFLIRV